jgi:predicted permease
MGSTHALFTSLRDELRPLATLAAAVSADLVVSRDRGEPVTLNAEIVSSNYFEMLQLRPAAGRFFVSATAVDDDLGVVIAHDVWRRLFQLAPDVVGQFVFVNGTPLQVIGVAPERFRGVVSDGGRFWLPFPLAQLALRRDGLPASIENVGSAAFEYVGRLKGDATIQQLEAAARPIVYRLADGAQDRSNGPDRLSQQMMALFGAAPVGARVTKYWRGGRAPTWYELAAWITAAMSLPFLVLAIACVNAGNLVLARAMRAIQVWNVHLALGATRWRLLRQPIAEGLMLAVPAAAAGLLLTRWGFFVVEPLIPFDLLIDWRVVAFAILTGALTPVVFGVGPVWTVLSRARRTLPGHLWQSTTRSRLRTSLLVAQAALSIALLGTGTQWIRTVREGLGDGLGRGDRMVVASLDVDKLGLTREATDSYYEAVLERVKGIPGASRAGLLAGIPDLRRGGGRVGQASVWRSDNPPHKPIPTMIAYVTPGLFPTLGIPVVSGRTFLPVEHAGPLRGVIVNVPFVVRHLGANPIGQQLRLYPGRAGDSANPYLDATDVVVVGVVREPPVRRTDTAPMVFAPVPAVHLPARTLYVPVNDEETLQAALPLIRETIRSVDARIPYAVERLDDLRWHRSEPRRFMALAVAILGSLALILAAVGLYGAVSYAVELRTREIGVRMAVGATSGSVLRTILREAMKLATVGCAIGTAVAAAVAVVGRSQMYGASTVEPVAFGATIALLMTTMLLASVVPAARAARIDPITALRSE